VVLAIIVKFPNLGSDNHPSEKKWDLPARDVCGADDQ